MCSNSPPPAPDYSALAKEQAAANEAAAKKTAYLSNPNVISPTGKRTVTYDTTYATPEPTKPVLAAPTGLSQKEAEDRAAREVGGTVNRQNLGAYQALVGKYTAGTNEADRAAYDKAMEDYNKQYNDWKASAIVTPTIKEELTPEAQAAFTAQQATQKALAELGLKATGTVSDVMSKPFQYSGPGIQTSLGDAGQITQDLGDYGQITKDLDISKLAAMPVNAGTTAQQAMMSRLQPQLQQERSQLETQLANQGVTPGSQAYQRAMMDQNKRENDLLTQTSLQGINLDMAARQQGLNEAGLLGGFRNAAQQQAYGQALGSAGFRNAAQNQLYNQMLSKAQFGNTANQQNFERQLGLYNLPLNQVSALMSGSQVQMPQFQPYQGAGVTAAPIFQAGQAQYQAGLDQYNADVAAGNAQMQGVTGMAMAAATAY